MDAALGLAERLTSLDLQDAQAPPRGAEVHRMSHFGLMTHPSLSYVRQASNADDLVRALGFLSLRTEQGVPCKLRNRSCPFRCRRLNEAACAVGEVDHA